MKRQAGVIIGVLAVAVAVAGGLLVRHKRAQQETVQAPSPLMVDVKRLVSAPASLTLQAVADVEPMHEVLIGSRMMGYVTQLPLSEGSRFKKGDLLVQIDPGAQGELPNRRDPVSSLSSQDPPAGYKTSRSVLDAELKAAEANMLVEQERLRRTRSLYDMEGVSLEQLQAAQASTAVAASRLTSARQNAGSAAVMAPFDGVVSQRLAQTGDSVAPGKPLLKIQDSSRGVRLLVDVPGAIVPKAVYLGTRTLPLQPWPQAGTSGTRRFEARTQGAELWPGARIPVRLEIFRADKGIVVPHDCMLAEQDNQAVLLAIPNGSSAGQGASRSAQGEARKAEPIRVTLLAQAEEGGVVNERKLEGASVACGSPDVLARLLAGVPVRVAAGGG